MIKEKGESLVLFGDMNRHLGPYIVGNEKDKLSFGGKQILDLVDSDYTLVNASSKVVGGPFTRYNPSDPDNESKKSILSLCIVSNDLVKFIDSLIIDKDKEFTPYRVVSNNKVVYTDHYSAMLKFKDLPIKSHIKEGKVRKV